LKSVSQRLAKNVAVVIPRQGDNRATAQQERAKHLTQVGYGRLQRVRSGKFTEQVARDEQNVRAALMAAGCYLLDGRAC
jgi:hypothetical protein